MANNIGRPNLVNKRVTISVRVDPELLEEIRSMESLSLTQAVENGLKLLLSNHKLYVSQHADIKKKLSLNA